MINSMSASPWPASSHEDTPSGGGATSVAVVRELDRLDELSDAWDLLAARSGSPLHQYAWIRACAASLLTDRELHFFVAGTAPRITAIAPLIGRRRRGCSLQLIAADELYEPMDFLYAVPDALDLLAEALARSGHALLLKRIPSDSPVIPALRRSFRGRGVVICRPVPGCPWIPLDSGWMEPEQRLNPGRRSDFRRARRIAERMGPVSSEVLSPAPARLEPLLEEAFRVEASSWKGRDGTALADDPARGLFYRSYATAACKKGILRVCFLRIGGRAAAMQLAVECAGRFWLLKIGYDQKFQRCSPGILLIRETVRYAAARGLRGYEFLGIVEPWTEAWTDEVRPCVSVRAYPARWAGVAALAVDLAGYARRRLGRARRAKR